MNHNDIVMYTADINTQRNYNQLQTYHKYVQLLIDKHLELLTIHSAATAGHFQNVLKFVPFNVSYNLG